MKFLNSFNKFIENASPKKRAAAFFLPIISLILVAAILLTAQLTSQSGANQAETKIPDRPIVIATPGEYISLHDNSLGEIFLPALEGVAKNTLKTEGFNSDETFKYYYENDTLSSMCGIDVSEHQGEIDWAQVKAYGVDFAIIRLGGRGYGNGSIFLDEHAMDNILGAQEAGIKVGVYFFSQAISAEEAVEEAEFCIGQLNGITLDFPLVFDWEIIGGSEARTDVVSPKTLTEAARAFCDKVENAGFMPMIYASPRLAYYKYDLSQLSDIPLWLVQYVNYTPEFYYNFDIWQFTDSGTIPGIDGGVDINICFRDFSKYISDIDE